MTRSRKGYDDVQPQRREEASARRSLETWTEYFLWTARDNFEWVDGDGSRFVLIYVDFDTLERIPKLSAEWFSEARATEQGRLKSCYPIRG